MGRKKRAAKSGGAKAKRASKLPDRFFDIEPDLQTLTGLPFLTVAFLLKRMIISSVGRSGPSDGVVWMPWLAILA